ncbi:Serine--tRNA ligase, mitochondrial [Drechslerella dactyloides]|uniref:serine--tRNA ligase n=1 Tax=Drechslerella dactyloides TaxID=74499 RepID=A0AAD6IRM3_DREDA|nr:Serine--tRNA ligase, mitochondrial [Drechslerella dactyloides]
MPLRLSSSASSSSPLQSVACNLSTSLAALHISASLGTLRRPLPERLLNTSCHQPLSWRPADRFFAKSPPPFARVTCLHTSASLDARNTRKPPSNPWSVAKAAEKREKVRARRDDLRQQRKEAASDPVIGHTTPFLEAMDAKPDVMPPIDHLVRPADGQQRQTLFEKVITEERLGRLNHFLQPEEVAASLARSKELEELPAAKTTESTIRQATEMHLKATAAMNRILSLGNGSSRDKTRANKAWCIETFGRHMTDEAFPKSKYPSISSNPATDPVKTPRVGRDTGSSEVQAALLTMKIRSLAKQLETNSHDKMNKRNLRLMARYGPRRGHDRFAPLLRRFSVSSYQLDNISAQTPAQPPSFAPRPIIATKPIRENPEAYSLNCLRRNLPTEATYPSRIATLSDNLYEFRGSLNQTRSRQNALQATIKSLAPKRTQAPEEWERLQLQAKELKHEIAQAETVEQRLEDEMNSLAAQLPNLSHPETPHDGKPHLVEYINGQALPIDEMSKTAVLSGLTNDQTPELMFTGSPGLSHVEIGSELGILDLASSTKTSGWGWYFLHGDAVRLEHALIQYALDCARRKGWALVSTPSTVYTHIAGACGFKPRDHNNEQQIYHISQSPSLTPSSESSKPELCLAGTAEIPLAGMLANTATPQKTFPQKMVGISRCFRAEAGAHGLATKGLYRVHEFTKVELFAWTLPDADVSDKIFKEILDIQREILHGLGLSARMINMPTDDLGAPAYRKYDIEAFLPSRQGEKYGGWGEVTSVSECTDYQARRLNARYRTLDGKLRFLWSLNGTALAVPRIIMAILENGWDETKREVRIPEALRGYLSGLKAIRKQSNSVCGTFAD